LICRFLLLAEWSRIRERDNNMSASIEVKVRYSETDRMGIAHHAQYYVWFEEARTELFRMTGYSYREMEQKGLLLPVIETQCKYKKAVTYDDDILVTAKLSEFKGATMVITYNIVKKDTGDTIAEGMTKHGCVNKEMKPIRLKKVFPEIAEGFERGM